MIIIILVIYFVSISALAGMWPKVVYLPLIFLMIWGGITIRRELGKFSDFEHAFVTVLIISLTATMLFDSFNYVLYNVIDPQIPVIVKEKKIEMAKDILEKFGSTDEKIDEAVKKIEDVSGKPTLKMQLMIYVQSIIIGAIFSLLIGLFVNRPDDRPVIKAQE